MEHKTEYDDELTPDESDRLYLLRNPELECAMWGEWVCTCLDWKKLPHPTKLEWDWLRSKWYHGKAPIDSANELIHWRKTDED